MSEHAKRGMDSSDSGSLPTPTPVGAPSNTTWPPVYQAPPSAAGDGLGTPGLPWDSAAPSYAATPPAPLPPAPAYSPLTQPLPSPDYGLASPSLPNQNYGLASPSLPNQDYGLAASSDLFRPASPTPAAPAPSYGHGLSDISVPAPSAYSFDSAPVAQVPATPAIPMDDLWREPAQPVDDLEDEDDYDSDESDASFDDTDDPDDGVGGLFDSPTPVKGHGFRNALIIVLVLAILGGLGYVGYTKGRSWLDSRHAPDYPGPGEADVTVTIPKGAGASTMGTILLQADVVMSVQAFTDAVSADPMTFDKIQYGDHKLQTKMSGVEALNALADPSKISRRMITIIEGQTYQQTFQKINTVTGLSLDDLNAIADDPSDLGLPNWGEKSIEGFLFPDTYEYGMNPSASALLGAMVSNFNSVTDSLNFAAGAQAEGLTPYEALVLASIVQREGVSADHPEYAANIAQVFLNRLAKKMKLQSDATVAYANGITGRVTTTTAERNLDSPYNTYKYTGLPPGPIASPGKAALTATINPTQGDLLYFVVVNLDTGEVKFASTAAEHNKNVDEFHAWCQANKGRC